MQQKCMQVAEVTEGQYKGKRVKLLSGMHPQGTAIFKISFYNSHSCIDLIIFLCYGFTEYATKNCIKD